MNESWYKENDALSDLDEGYWQSLLGDGEIVSSPPPASFEPSAFWSDHTDGQRTSANKNRLNSREEDWGAAERVYASGEMLSLPVTGYNRGGLLVQFKGLCGFVPASHLVNLPRLSDPAERLNALARQVGELLDVCVIEIDREQGRLIMSQRAAREGRYGQNILQSLKPGDRCRGRVTNIRPFGVFVDLGGIEGLIHVSELSWGRVGHPSEIVHPGDEVDVYVISIDCAQRKIALSIKRLAPDPWKRAAERYRVGQIVTGVVTNVVSFGAFTRIEEGLEGLIHISELAEGHFLHPRNVVQEGDTVRVRILNIDPDNHRMGLSLRHAGRPTSEVQAAQDVSSPRLQSVPQGQAIAWQR
jgi:small subunit ribosomal protein S1